MNRILLVALATVLFAVAALARPSGEYASPRETRAALAAALAERAAAEARSEEFERQAAEASTAAGKAARQAAALAARIQQAEAGISAARTRIAMIDAERARLGEAIGREQGPVVRLTAALQQFSRRPVALAVLQPGSVKDLVYVRALLHDAVPQVRARTRDLRERVAHGRALRREALAASTALQAEEQVLVERRRELVDMETRQRLAARSAGSEASREADRALALAEQARDLDGLLGELGAAQQRRDQLAALSGPVLRPASPGTAPTEQPLAAAGQSSTAVRSGAPQPYILPVAGRVITGYRAPLGSGLSNGITLAPLGGAQVVAPASGRVAFAGPYRGYGQIVIIEHAGGWTSLVTGLAQASVTVGQQVTGGAPLGRAAPERPTITLELRQGSDPVNPLLHTG